MKRLCLGLLMLISGNAVVSAADPDANGATNDPTKVLACMRANVPMSPRVQDVEFVTSDQAGTSGVLKGRLYVSSEKSSSGARHTRSMLHVNAPPSLAGAAYLIREKDGDQRDGMYVYLPSVKRVRRVTGSIADGGLMGTSFSYADFKQLQNSFGDVRVEREGTGEIDKRAMHVVTFTSRHPDDGGYSLVRAWIDFQTCTPLKAEFYEGKSIRKRMTSPVASLKQSGTHWYASIVEMTDLKDSKRSTLRVLDVTQEKEVPGSYFDPKTFYQR